MVWCRSRWILGGAFVCGIVVVASIVRLSFASVLRRPDPEPRKCNVTRLLDNRRGERVSIREFYRAFVTNRMSSFALCVAALGTGIVWGRRGLSLGEDAGHTLSLCKVLEVIANLCTNTLLQTVLAIARCDRIRKIEWAKKVTIRLRIYISTGK